MKHISNKYFKLLTLISLTLFAFACSKELKDSNLEGSDYTLKSQAEVASFKGTASIRTLTITGNDITDLSALQFKTVRNLIIEHTGIKNLSMPQLTSVTVSLTIKDNSQLEAINGLNNFKFMNGAVLISNNKVLTNISGLLSLKIFEGSLDVNNNPALGENQRCLSNETGFCVIKYLLNNSILKGKVTLSNNHPDAATDPEKIGVIAGGDILSFTLGSKSDVEQFSPPSDTVQNLTITGKDITSEVIAMVKSRISVIKGVLTVENTSIGTTENFIEVIKCEGSIIFRNNAQLSNPNGFKNYTIIHGDLIIEDCPKMYYWGVPRGQAGFSGITRVEGNLKLSPVPEMGEGGNGLTSLTYVGGDFEINGDPAKGEIWNLDTWYQLGGGIKHIGGNLTYKNHFKVNGLGGFQNLEYLGGDVYIMDNGGEGRGSIPLQSGTNMVGFCLIKKFLDNGIMKKTNPVIQLRTLPGTPFIDVNSLTACDN